MKRILLASLLILLYNIITFSQINQYGLPLIKNYTLKDYNAWSQNWDVVQDSKGIMYFANNDGVLEYDGNNWELIKINNAAIVRSLAIDSLGIIYVGAENEFGFIQANQFGKLYYTSLSDSLLDEDKDFAIIQKVYHIDEGIMFCAFKKIFKYSKGKIQTINLPKGGFYTLKVNNDFYMGEYYEGLMKFENDSFVLCKGGDFYKNMDIFDVFPFKHNLLIVATSSKGLFIYNPNTGESLTPSNKEYTELHDYIIENYLYGTSLYQEGFLVNTLYGGAAYIDSNLAIKELYNRSNGLQDEVVLNMYQKEDILTAAPLWLALNNGISKVENNSALRYFSESHGLHDEILDIANYKGEMYFASINGVYKLKNKGVFPVFNQVERTEGECWSFLEYNQKLVIGGGYNIFELKNDKVGRIETEDMVFKLYKSTIHQDKIFVGEGNGIYIYNFKQRAKYNKINGIQDRIYDIIEDKNGNLWLTTGNNELIRVSFSKNDTIIKYYNDSLGFVQTESLKTFKYKNTIYFSTENSLLKYNQDLDILEPVNDGDSIFRKEAVHAIQFEQDKKGNLWFVSVTNGINRLKLLKNNDGFFEIVKDPFLRIPNCMINSIYPDDNGIVWIGTSEGLFTYNTNIELNYDEPFNTLIRKVFVGEDSIIYYGNKSTNQKNELSPILDYKNNGLTFHYAAPFFIEESETEYSYFLDGPDSEKSAWSNWTKKTDKEYTYLHEGKYTFKVKAKNIYGIESTVAEYSFEISPPWRRTILAYIIYGILAILTVWIIVKLNVRRLQYEKKKLEGIVEQRTNEIRCQKNEIELQKEEITDSIKYAKRIQKAILPPDELLLEHLPQHFILFKPRDIVSGDFYWMQQIEDYTLITAADCTGHGVPGAFMSMLGIAFLNEIVKQDNILSPGDALTELRNHVKHSLRQTGKEGEAKDGMDIAFCVINKKKMKLQFAGAYNPLYLFRNNNQSAIKEFEGLKIIEDENYNLYEIKADKMPIGIHIAEKEKFTTHEIDLKKGDTFYMFSDGYVDQIGGEKNKKFMAKPFKKLLFEIQDLEMDQQKIILNETIENWKGTEEQVDDIVVIGVRI